VRKLEPANKPSMSAKKLKDEKAVRSKPINH
jgi:hypothetical protein